MDRARGALERRPAVKAVCSAALALFALPSAAAGAGGPGLQAPAACRVNTASAVEAPAARAAAEGPRRVVIAADSLRGRPDRDAVAEGGVRFSDGVTTLSAARVEYDAAADLATARGGVVIERGGDTWRATEGRLHVQRRAGRFEQPTFRLGRAGAEGRASSVELLDASRSIVADARYSSCPFLDGAPEAEPDWLLAADRLRLDLDANEGIADGAVLRFLGVPILAFPAFSFPLTDARKSGWLPPSINLDTKGGLDLTVPWYWNLAPNRDATIAPRIVSRRGAAVDAEVRWLEARHAGEVRVEAMPEDRLADRSRWSARWLHEATLPLGWQAEARGMRVSDDAWWKDFAGATPLPTPRLLPLALAAERRWTLAAGAGGGGGSGFVFEGQAYARVQQWQTLQDPEAPILVPYQRSPQAGLAWRALAPGRVEALAEVEFNRFTLTDRSAGDDRREGSRVHVLGRVERAWRGASGFVVPRLTLNAASYRLDAAAGEPRSFARAIPTFALDAGLAFERDATGFGRALLLTLEPRMFYVLTPFEAQAGLPNFDAAAKDFDFASIWSENAFSGIDRVSDANQLTAGATTRVLDAATGAELLRLGVAQRVRFRTQRVAPQADGTPDGEPLSQRFSDVLLLGATDLVPGWNLDAAIQYSPDARRLARSIVGARWSPGAFRTVNARYRLARGVSEQVELGWQWPLAVQGPRPGRACGLAWYGVGRLNYSLRDSRMTDSLAGVEIDAGCWIARIVAERQSTGRSEANTRLMLQLELTGLSRLGSNPLRTLKDNVPGYRLLREERAP
jgi:LPS-assembly protein